MQTLKLSPSLMPAARTGDKKATTRLGHRDITLGTLMLENAGDANDTFPVQVREVTVKMASSLNDEDAAREGYQYAGDLHRALQQFYPSMTGSDPITIVQWF